MKNLVALIVLVAVFMVPGVVIAQESKLGGVAVNVEIAEGAESGDIISYLDGGLTRSSSEYDNGIYGVVVDDPIISVEPRTDNTRAVVSTNEASVKVTNSNGPISVGDFITSSANAGVGMKATNSGYVLGKALAAYDSGEVGQIPVSLEIGYVQIGDSVGGSGLLQSIVGDEQRLRLFLTAILAFLVLIGGIIAFARLVNTGVRAIGRNPLARATIMRGMFISGAVVVFIMLLGFGAAVAIIVLGS